MSRTDQLHSHPRVVIISRKLAKSVTRCPYFGDALEKASSKQLVPIRNTCRLPTISTALHSNVERGFGLIKRNLALCIVLCIPTTYLLILNM